MITVKYYCLMVLNERFQTDRSFILLLRSGVCFFVFIPEVRFLHKQILSFQTNGSTKRYPFAPLEYGNVNKRNKMQIENGQKKEVEEGEKKRQRIERDSSVVAVFLPLWYNGFQPIYSLTVSTKTHVNMYLGPTASFQITDNNGTKFNISTNSLTSGDRSDFFCPNFGTNEEITISLCFLLFYFLWLVFFFMCFVDFQWKIASSLLPEIALCDRFCRVVIYNSFAVCTKSEWKLQMKNKERGIVVIVFATKRNQRNRWMTLNSWLLFWFPLAILFFLLHVNFLVAWHHTTERKWCE